MKDTPFEEACGTIFAIGICALLAYLYYRYGTLPPMVLAFLYAGCVGFVASLYDKYSTEDSKHDKK